MCAPIYLSIYLRLIKMYVLFFCVCMCVVVVMVVVVVVVVVVVKSSNLPPP